MTAAGAAADPTERWAQLSLGAAVLGVLLFSTGPTIIAEAETNGLTIAFWRVVMGWGFVALLMALHGGAPAGAYRQTMMAGIGFGTASALFFSAVQITSVANAVLITVLQPVPLVFAGRFFFGERVRPAEAMWVAAAVAGAAVMVLSGSSADTGDPKGDLLAVAAMLLTAVYFIGSKRARGTLPTLPFMVGLWFWAALALAPILVVSGEGLVPASGGDWVRVTAIAVLPGLGHYLTNFSHRGVSLAVVGVLQLFTPVGAALLALWFLDQRITTWQWLGMLIVIVSLTVYTTLHSREE